MSRLVSIQVRHSVPVAALVGWLLLLSGTGCAHTVPLTVMTFNIRYGTADDGLNSWKYRRPMVVDVIKKHDPDVMGLQEVLAFQRDELLAALPGYDCVGVGRDDGKEKGEFAPILFKRDKFDLIRKGWFWLSEAPERPGSIGWDAACPRIATWVRLRVKQAPGGEFCVLNTHLDHKGRVARQKSGIMFSVWLMSQLMSPYVVVGDFNTGATDPIHRSLLIDLGGISLASARNSQEQTGIDAYEALNSDEPDSGTFNAFEGVHTGDRIDWILTTRHFIHRACEIDRSSRNGRYPSDHFPVIARVELLPRAVVADVVPVTPEQIWSLAARKHNALINSFAPSAR